ncbi:MAG: hypothetical protein AAFR52_00900 [Pseudomonadota bacterium]
MYRHIFIALMICGVMEGTEVRAAPAATTIQTAGVEAEAMRRNLERRAGAPPVTGDGPLVAEAAVPFDPGPAGLGGLTRVRIAITAHLAHGFSGMVGDGAPLDEAPGEVWIDARLTARLALIGPDGAVLAERRVEGRLAGCDGEGSCVFAHHERQAVELVATIDAAILRDAAEPVLTLRATTTGGVLAQVCHDTDGWDRCIVREARLGFSTSPHGVRVSGADTSAALAHN